MRRYETDLSEPWELAETFSRSNPLWTSSPTSRAWTRCHFGSCILGILEPRPCFKLLRTRPAGSQGKKGDGRRGRGIAYCRYKSIGMYAAAVVDVEVNRKTGAIKVPRVVLAADIGLVINPDGAKNQLEGGIVQAVSLTLKEQVSFDKREITSPGLVGLSYTYVFRGSHN
jgi:hypothetical protein